jgi:hypothetical protein
MGLGNFDNTTGEVGLLVTFQFPLTPGELDEWQDAFKAAANRFFQTTRQKLKISKISFSVPDGTSTPYGNINGGHAADIVVHSNLGVLGYAYLNRFSKRGGNANINGYFAPDQMVNTIVHELAHYMFNVNDEYRTEWFQLNIDELVDLDALIAQAQTELGAGFPPGPDTPEDLRARFIPLVPGQNIPGDFSIFNVKIGNDLQNRIMFVVRDNYAITNAPFLKPDESGQLINAIPQTDADSPVYYYEGAACSGESIMQNADYNGNDSAGQLLCMSSNHVAGTPETAQHSLHEQSCWETLVDNMQEMHGFDIEAASVLSYSDPVVETLLPQRRLAIVFDRSGSMGSDGKMANAQAAANAWLNTFVPGEYVSLTWYNEAPSTTQQLTELIEGSAGNYANQLAVNPSGFTNIRDALLRGLEQVSDGAPGVAAVKAVVLMTDGLHNRPVNSDARSVIERFKAASTPIYAIGFGQDDQVDMDLLDDLAAGTGGVSYSGVEESDFIDAVIRISFELRTGLVLDWIGELGAAGEVSKATSKLEQEKTKPPLLKLLARKRLIDFRLKPHGKPKKENAVDIPVVIEEHSTRAFFCFRKHNRKDPAWCYLLDPDDNEIDFDSLGKAYFVKDGLEQVVIEKPKPGVWHMMIVKDESDKSKTAYSAMAASENPNLNVYADVNKQNGKGAPVRIWANVNWVEPLSDVKVEAEVTAPNGQQSTIELHESSGDLQKKGIYEGFYSPLTSGRFTGKVKVSNNGNATRALAGSHPPHDNKDAKEGHTINIASSAPRFVRYANFYFDSGPRPKTIDNDG